MDLHRSAPARTGLHKFLTLLALGAVLLGAVVAAPRNTAAGIVSPESLPDLVSDGATSPVAEPFFFGPGDTRLLMRFDGYIHNAGQGAAEIRSTNPTGDTMDTVEQRVFREDGSSDYEAMAGAQVKFENADGHNHWHLKNAARYSLWDASETTEVAPSMKVGFCLGDTQHIDPQGPAAAHYTIASFCQAGQPEATSVIEGISAGWRDKYPRSLPFQWVDISNVQPGPYKLATEVDPNDVVRESDESNNSVGFAAGFAVVPGYVAQPKSVGPIPNDRSRKITLTGAAHGAAGPASYVVESLPAHGTLDRAVGVASSDPVVTYTPDAGYEGPDQFDFSVHSANSGFPEHPASATVLISVETLSPSVAISGAPASMTAGTGVQLSATVVDDSPTVAWTASAGTVDGSGSFVAPASAPPGGKVTVAVETESGARDEVQIAIVDPPVPEPAPLLGAPPVAKKGALISKPGYVRHGKFLLVNVSLKSGGLVRISLIKYGRRLAGCHVRATAGQNVTCRIRLRGKRLRGLTLFAALMQHDKPVAQSQIRIRKRSALSSTARAQWLCDLTGRPYPGS